MDANAQFVANLPGNGSCVIDNDPYWQGEENSPTQCMKVDGANNGHQQVLVTDINPNSPTYNQTQWADMGENTSACPLATCINCSGEGYKCVNGFCQLGMKIYTTSACISGHCEFTYHYEWSDGSWSPNYTEIDPGGCSGGFHCQLLYNP